MGSEPKDNVLTTCERSTHMLVCGISSSWGLYCSWCFEQIFEDMKSFLLQMKCMMSASVEVPLYWAWLIISAWENEPKWKETSVNHYALGHHRSIEEYACTRENRESVKQYARIVWASLKSSLEVARYDCLPTLFSLAFQPSLISVKN